LGEICAFKPAGRGSADARFPCPLCLSVDYSCVVIRFH
jgi:hypothetical protein